MKHNILKKSLILMLAAVLVLSLFTGCGAAKPSLREEAPSMTREAAGTLLLSVNPEIEVEYDDGGLVLEVEGINEDGHGIVSGLQNYKGRTTTQVVNKLVEKIYESGYFEQTVGGNTKNIVIKLEQGSAYPDSEFLDEVAQGVRSTVSKIGVDTKPMTVKEADYSPNGLIGLEKAKELVLAQLGLSEADFTEREYELDDGVYELEFTANGMEYEYDVCARTGKILEAEMDRDDDRDDRDDDRDGGRLPKGLIGLEKAKEVVLSRLGLSEADLRDRDYDLDDGVYELEFTANGMEYEYDVCARTGKILKAEADRDDDWDDDDWDDDDWDDDDRDDDDWDDDDWDDDDWDDDWDDDDWDDDDDDDEWDD